jgi:two-component system response regulator AtoC
MQLHECPSGRRLCDGATVNVSPAGILAECELPGAFCEGQLVEVHIGLLPEVWPERNEPFRARVRRMESEGPLRLALEVVGKVPACLSIPELVGFHPSILDVKQQLLGILDYDVNVLVEGESGTGKNVVASAIHRYSRRWKAPFIRVNCPSIPGTLLESQLFGHEKGAYTDAARARPGLFRIADKGTIVLDEISAVPSSLQAKFLQVIEEKRFIPVGGHETVEVDVRLIATSNADPEKRLKEGAFRTDLFYRLNEVNVTLSPLRERQSDIPILADHFLRKWAAAFRKKYRPLDSSTLEMFLRCTWPGNVRELENTIKHAVLMGRFSALKPEAEGTAPAGPRRGGAAPTGEAPATCACMREAREKAEKQALVEALVASRYNRTAAASHLGVSYQTLLRRLRKYGVEL